MKFFKVAGSLTILFWAFVLPIFAQTAETEIFGYYYIKKPSQAFANISEIHLAGNYGAQRKPPVYGFIRLKAKKTKDFRLLKPTLKGKNLIFTTKRVGDISYTFSGTFTKLGDFPSEQPNGEILLKGVLIKLKGKIKLSQANVRFTYFAGD